MKKYLPVIIFFVVFASCKQKGNPEITKAINESLERANAFIRDKNDLIYATIDEKAKDPMSKGTAGKWSPIAIHVSEWSSGLNTYIDSIKKTMAIFKENGSKETATLFNGKGVELYDKLAKYSRHVTDVLDVDSFTDNPYFKKQLDKDIVQFKKDIATRFGLLVDDTSTTFISVQAWIDRYLSNTNTLQGISMLNKLQNDVLMAENDLAEYCKNSTTFHGCILDFDVFHAIAILSSSYVKTGQTIEVSAGIGKFTAAAKPRITVDGKEYKTDQDGVVVHSFAVKGKPGKYHVPVTIEFYKPDGSMAKVTKQLEYIIAE